MADNTTLNLGEGGDDIRTLEDSASVKWPVGVAAYAISVGTPDSLQVVTPSQGLPVTPDSGGFSVTVSGTVAISAASLPLPTGAATAAKQQTDALTDAQLRATPVPISGTVTVGAHAVTNAGTFAVQEDGAALTALQAIQTAVQILDNIVAGAEAQVDVVTSALPTGAATAAKQDTAIMALAAIQTAIQILDNAIAGTEMQVDVITSALPTGAATAANQQTDALTDTELRATPVPVSGTVNAAQSGAWNITNVSGTVSLPTGASTSANQSTANTALAAIQAALEGTLTVGAHNVTNAGTFTVQENAKTSNASHSNVSGSASSVQLLASNANRAGATIVNDSTAVLYVKFGTTASATDYAYRLASNDTLELPKPIFTGRIDGIWESAAGAARITEMT